MVKALRKWLEAHELLAIIAGEVFPTAEIVAVFTLVGHILVLHTLFLSSSIRRAAMLSASGWRCPVPLAC